MNLEKKLRDLDQSIGPDQRQSLRDNLGAMSWQNYEEAIAPGLEEDDRSMAILRFVFSLPNAGSFKDNLTHGQREIVEEIEAYIAETFLSEE